MRQGKVWGSTELLLATPFLEVHRLRIKPNARCSFHLHRFKWNAFFVLSGELLIDVEKNDYALTDTTVLKAGDITTVKPTENHRFRTKPRMSCEALEIYYCEPLSADIIRRDVGGVGAAKAKKR